MDRKNRFKQVRSWLSTYLRPGFRPGLQLARMMLQVIGLVISYKLACTQLCVFCEQPDFLNLCFWYVPQSIRNMERGPEYDEKLNKVY